MTGGVPASESRRLDCGLGGNSSHRRTGKVENIMFAGTAIILGFFLLHFWASLFMQTFFHHRYASHGMFRLSRGWERFFHAATYVLQGSSYIEPAAYAWLHRAHHAYADTERDPHSPHHASGLLSMMWQTKARYSALRRGTLEPEARFTGYTPAWPALDRLGSNYFARVAWGALYTLVYVAFAPHWSFFLLLPAHFLMGPIHGAIVNWAGHKYGYRNYDLRDESRNAWRWDVLMLGELFQNNHHRHPQSPNFAARPDEFDPAYLAIKGLHRLGALDLSQRPPSAALDSQRPPSAALEVEPPAHAAPAGLEAARNAH
jgi:stearoyl-CoA desaturase (delta-9 desaturase)